MSAEQLSAENLSAGPFRDRFPALRTLTWLASCSQGALSDAVAAALAEFQAEMLAGNPWGAWTARVDRSREAFAALVGAPADEVAVLGSASECAYQVVSGLDFAAGESVVTTEQEFPSVAHVWQAQRARGAQVRFAATTADGFATVEGYRAAIDGGTRLVSVPLVSYRNGQRLPVAEIAALAAERGAQVFVDAYQGLGALPADVTALGCDYLASGTTKYLLGVPGLAFLRVRAGLRRDREPELTGWFGRADPFAFDPRTVDHPPGARRYEVGSPPVPAAYAAVAGLDLLAGVGATAIAAHVGALTEHLHTELVAAGESIASPAAAADRGPVVALVDDDPAGLAARLAEQGVVASPRGRVLRLAVHRYTDHTDVEALLRALARCRSRDG